MNNPLDNKIDTPISVALSNDSGNLHNAIVNHVTDTIKTIASNQPDTVNAGSLIQQIKQYIDAVIATLNAIKDLPQFTNFKAAFTTAIVVLTTLETLLGLFGG